MVKGVFIGKGGFMPELDMGEAGDYFRLKFKEREYPCGKDGSISQIIGDDDFLVRESEGVYRRITGFCIGGCQIPDSHVEKVVGDKRHLLLHCK